MRILWHSTPFWGPTGYATQTKNIITRLRDRGHEIALFARDGYTVKGIINVGGFRVYPTGDFPDGHDLVGGHMWHWQADMLVGFYDSWVIPTNFHDGFAQPMAQMFPIDSYPTPDIVQNHAAVADYQIVYSQFGARMMAEAKRPCHYIPHGIDVEVFRPLDRAAVRKQFQVDDGAFMVGIFGANYAYPSRKGIPEMMLAIARLQRKYPNVWFYLHSRFDPPQGNIGAGLVMVEVMEKAGIDLDRFIHVNQYELRTGLFTEHHLAKAYNMCDVICHASLGEGFGLSIVEGQACGTPVITTNHSSMPELTVNGVCTEPVQPFWSSLGGWFALPSVERIYEALEEILQRTDGERKARNEQGVAFVRDHYNINRIVDDYWLPFLATVESDIVQKHTKRARRRKVKENAVGGLPIGA